MKVDFDEIFLMKVVLMNLYLTVWLGRVRGESPCGQVELRMLGEWWGSPPPFLHTDSEHAGVNPSVSAQS